MRSINIREARRRFSDLVDAAQRGQSALITRRGREVAKVGPSDSASDAPLPDLTAFRQSIRQALEEGQSEPLSKTVIESREQARF